MIEFIYPVFFWILVIEVAIFSFLNLPSPKGWKGTVVKFINTNIYVKKFLKVHLWICLLALFFFYDSYTTEQKLGREKDRIKHGAGGEISQELRKGFLSYTILKVQRNEYITLMLVYASIALNVYLQILNYMYTKR
jgi:hypothetical protein